MSQSTYFDCGTVAFRRKKPQYDFTLKNKAFEQFSYCGFFQKPQKRFALKNKGFRHQKKGYCGFFARGAPESHSTHHVPAPDLTA